MQNSYARLRYDKWIPCNCPACQDSQDPHFYRFNKLKEWIADGRKTVDCDNRPYHTVNVSSLINDAIDLNQSVQRGTSADTDSASPDIQEDKPEQTSQSIVTKSREMHILHLCDLHFGTEQDAIRWHSQLRDDLRQILPQLTSGKSPHPHLDASFFILHI